MLVLALGIGIFSYTLFALGLLGLFNIPVFIFLLFTFLIFSIVLILKYGLIEKMKLIAIYIFTSKSNLLKLLISFLAAMLLINFIIALSPERGFDALWYHLMIPKLYVQNHGVFYIPGSLLYYSPMPKLLDLLYIIPIGLHLDFLTRLISLSFGILTLFTTYYFAKIFVRRSLAILVPVILFSNIVFSWQMTTAYIDIGRTFFEILSIFTLFLWMQNKKQSLFIESALCMGLAIATKPISFISLFSILFFIAFYGLRSENPKKVAKQIVVFFLSAVIVPLPWLIFSLTNTGSPFYPFFTKIYEIRPSASLLNPLVFVSEVFKIFTTSPDPISPLFIIILPLLVICFKKFNSKERLLLLYCILSLLAWYVTPRTGGGRFMLVYLPVFSILVAIILKHIQDRIIYRFVFGLVLFFAFIAFTARLYVGYKVAPVVFGFESKDEFLSRHLNFEYGDFYDTDRELAKLIGDSDMVLIYGGHNLYYVNFPFIHESWIKKGDVFNYILTQDTELPNDFYFFKLVYENKKTHVNLYSGEGFWKY